MTKHGETILVFRRKIKISNRRHKCRRQFAVLAVCKNIHPAGFKLLILENTVLNPVYDDYLMV